MRYYLIAGEASGDLHGANLIAALQQKDDSAVLRAWGGNKMQQQGAQIVKHYKHLAFMGFWEVLKNIRTILANVSFCKKDILNFKPDALILIDYPGFNMIIAKWATRLGIRMDYFYYFLLDIYIIILNHDLRLLTTTRRDIFSLTLSRNVFLSFLTFKSKIIGH